MFSFNANVQKDFFSYNMYLTEMGTVRYSLSHLKLVFICWVKEESTGLQVTT